MMIRLSSMKIALLIGTIYSRISLEQIKSAVDEVFEERKDDGLEYTIINPLFGYMFKANGCVENMRFYSPELEIKYNEREERIYPEDKSEDSLTKLVIHLFPSHAGALNSLVGTLKNFRFRYFIENKSFLSKSGKKAKGSQKDRSENIKMLGETCVKLLKNGTGGEVQKPSKNRPEPYTLFNWLVFSPSKAFKQNEEVCLKVLLIYVFVIEALDEKEELKEYLRAILTGLDSDPSIKCPALILDKKQIQLFNGLYANPFKFPYSKINQPVSNSSIPVYDRKEDKPVAGQTFSDCADITILNLCNCLFYNELTGECSLDHLNLEDSPTEPNRLKQFYEKYHYRPYKVTQEMRNDWSRVVQGLDDNKQFECQGNFKPYMIHYCKQVYRNEIRSGLLNTMSVLASICGFNNEYEEIMTKDAISKYSVLEKLTEFFNKISNENP